MSLRPEVKTWYIGNSPYILVGTAGRSDWTEFQTARQSARQRPWHLNSSPGPPIRPPHSGQTQFRMLETISAIGLKGTNVVNDTAAHLCSYGKVNTMSGMHLRFHTPDNGNWRRHRRLDATAGCIRIRQNERTLRFNHLSLRRQKGQHSVNIDSSLTSPSRDCPGLTR